MNEPLQPDKTFAELVAELTRETTLLFRQEIDLAKAELTEKVSRAGAGVAEVAVGGVIILVSLLALTAAAIIALAQAIGWWQSALVIGVAVLLIGTAALIRGLANLRADRLTPQRTLASLRENRDWAKEQMR